jgi:hypothetical protein
VIDLVHDVGGLFANDPPSGAHSQTMAAPKRMPTSKSTAPHAMGQNTPKAPVPKAAAARACDELCRGATGRGPAPVHGTFNQAAPQVDDSHEMLEGIGKGLTVGLYTIVLPEVGPELLLGEEAAIGVEAAEGAAATAKELNQISHVFPRVEKGMEALVKASGGSELSALRGIQAAANRALAQGRIIAGPNGILPGKGLGAILSVNGVNIQLIGGRVINGVVELGSFVGL